MAELPPIDRVRNVLFLKLLLSLADSGDLWIRKGAPRKDYLVDIKLFHQEGIVDDGAGHGI